MLRTRVWTALVALPAVLALVVFTPDRIFTAAIALLTAWSLYEIATMTAVRGPLTMLALIAAGAVPAAIILYGGRGSWPAAISAIIAMCVLVMQVAVRGPDGGHEGAPLTILGALYVGLLFPYFALLRNRPGGIELFILMLFLVIASDTGAYFTGRWMGRVKLAPKVSPNKTVEGAAGGIAASIVAGWLLGPILAAEWPLATLTIVSAMIGLAAEVGDLANSAFKRSAGVKDSGWIFPGHGGLLDRAASLVFAVVITYYYAQ